MPCISLESSVMILTSLMRAATSVQVSMLPSVWPGFQPLLADRAGGLDNEGREPGAEIPRAPFAEGAGDVYRR